MEKAGGVQQRYFLFGKADQIIGFILHGIKKLKATKKDEQAGAELCQAHSST